MSDNYILTLNTVINTITLYVPYLTISLGTLGGLCNLITFTAKHLRQNPCGFYFLWSSIFDLCTLLCCGILRLMVDHYSYVLPNHSLIFCKLRPYLTVVFPALSTCCVMLASIDRCLVTSSSIHWRNLSTMKVAHRVLLTAIIVWLVSPAHMLAYYDYYTIAGIPNSCYSRPGVYAIFVSAFFIVWVTIIPYAIMFTSSMITLMHIRTSRQRITPLQQPQQLGIRHITRHLMIIMFLQVILSMLLLSMRSMVLSYQLLTNDVPKDSRRRTIESFISQFGIVLYYINYAKSFYLNIFTSPLFREVFWKRVNEFWKYICYPVKVAAKNSGAILDSKRRSNEPAGHH